MSRIRDLLVGLAHAVADHLESLPEQAKYYDQHNTPLSKQTHLRLARTGVLPSFKRAGRVFVERAVMHRYIEEGKVETRTEGQQDEDAILNGLLKKAG
ncbi:MAG TPA: hypothetical protein VJN18_32375 [Polyangiaceae bacterium]|nr:hypothetical protein [Polyangiaceae bacterium]